MSLLKTLNPEIRKALEVDREEYPNSYSRMISDIQDAYLVTDLPVGTANNLIDAALAMDMKFENENFVLRLYQIFGR